LAVYLYLPRLSDSQVLLDAINDGVTLLTWEKESFAYADSHDEAASRYRGLRHSQRMFLTDVNAGIVVKPEAARLQFDAEESAKGAAASNGGTTTQSTSGNGGLSGGQQTTSIAQTPAPAAQPKRFHGTVNLDPTRVGRDSGRIADEIISHPAGIVGAKVKVTPEIEAEAELQTVPRTTSSAR
jgi:hypothetical protein